MRVLLLSLIALTGFTQEFVDDPYEESEEEYAAAPCEEDGSECVVTPADATDYAAAPVEEEAAPQEVEYAAAPCGEDGGECVVTPADATDYAAAPVEEEAAPQEIEYAAAPCEEDGGECVVTPADATDYAAAPVEEEAAPQEVEYAAAPCEEDGGECVVTPADATDYAAAPVEEEAAPQEVEYAAAPCEEDGGECVVTPADATDYAAAPVEEEAAPQEVEYAAAPVEESCVPATMETPVEKKPESVKKVRRIKRRIVRRVIEREKNWYFTIAPGYFYFTDSQMRRFYGDGGVTFRGEFGYKFWGPLTVWVDGGYFQKEGHSLGIYGDTDLKVATITLGLKTLWYLHERVAFYLGAGPRLFMMMMNNSSPFVRSEDNGIGIGAGFDGGFWFFPIPQWKNFFVNVCADYSWERMKIEEDEVSSIDETHVDLSGVTSLIGLGIRF